MHDGEGHAGLVGVGVVERVPEGVALAEELAADLVPVLLRVGGRGDGVAALGTTNGPAGFGDLETWMLALVLGIKWHGVDGLCTYPHGLALGDGLECPETRVEEVGGVADAVGLGGLAAKS